MSSDERLASRRPRSRTDLVELAVYITNESIDAAERLLDAAEETFDFLASNPQAGAVYPVENPRLAGLRVFQIRGFPNHLAFYLERQYGIEIVRVLHGARNLNAILKME